MKILKIYTVYNDMKTDDYGELSSFQSEWFLALEGAEAEVRHLTDIHRVWYNSETRLEAEHVARKLKEHVALVAAGLRDPDLALCPESAEEYIARRENDYHSPYRIAEGDLVLSEGVSEADLSAGN